MTKIKVFIEYFFLRNITFYFSLYLFSLVGVLMYSYNGVISFQNKASIVIAVIVSIGFVYVVYELFNKYKQKVIDIDNAFVYGIFVFLFIGVITYLQTLEHTSEWELYNAVTIGFASFFIIYMLNLKNSKKLIKSYMEEIDFSCYSIIGNSKLAKFRVFNGNNKAYADLGAHFYYPISKVIVSRNGKKYYKENILTNEQCDG